MNNIINSTITLTIALTISFGSVYLYKKVLQKRLNPRRNTIVLLILNVIKYIVLLVSVLIIVTTLGIDMATLLAGAGFLGLLLGVGLQKLFQDMVSGFFIIFENHYVVGEFVTINNITGQVLEIGLKTTRIKTYEGELYLFSNGNIDNVKNYSRFPSLSLVDIHIPYIYNQYEVMEIIKNYTPKIQNKNIVSQVEVLGVQKVEPNYYDVRITCYTKSYEHFAVNRQINAEIVNELADKQIFVNVEKIIKIK
ncbi:MAG: mechanosensitive ion channel, partial [bacterium]